MKILHVTDLHMRESWYRWIEAEQRRFDLICISGDLMLLSNENWIEPEPPDPPDQAVNIANWLSRLTVPVAICSGNHDLGGEYIEIWKAQDPNKIWVDNETLQLDEVIVTCTPYDFRAPVCGKTGDAWIQGRALADKTGLPWLVLHHEPPYELGGEDDTRRQITRYHPDFLLCGHIHDWPIKHGWAMQTGRTWVLNPGVGKAEIPNHLVIDTHTVTVRWNGESAEGICYRR